MLGLAVFAPFPEAAVKVGGVAGVFVERAQSEPGVLGPDFGFLGGVERVQIALGRLGQFELLEVFAGGGDQFGEGFDGLGGGGVVVCAGFGGGGELEELFGALRFEVFFGDEACGLGLARVFLRLVALAAQVFDLRQTALGLLDGVVALGFQAPDVVLQVGGVCFEFGFARGGLVEAALERGVAEAEVGEFAFEFGFAAFESIDGALAGELALGCAGELLVDAGEGGDFAGEGLDLGFLARLARLASLPCVDACRAGGVGAAMRRRRGRKWRAGRGRRGCASWALLLMSAIGAAIMSVIWSVGEAAFEPGEAAGVVGFGDQLAAEQVVEQSVEGEQAVDVDALASEGGRAAGAAVDEDEGVADEQSGGAELVGGVAQACAAGHQVVDEQDGLAGHVGAFDFLFDVAGLAVGVDVDQGEVGGEGEGGGEVQAAHGDAGD